MTAPEFRPIVARLSAELFVIVAGVLIALWANEWWAERGERAEETEILVAMLEDVRASQVSLAQRFETQQEMLSNLLALAEGSTGVTAGSDDAEFNRMLYDALWEASLLDLQMSAYEEIKGAGRLALIESPELRRALAEYDASLAVLRRSRDDLAQHQQSKLDVYAIENFQMAQFADYLLLEEAEHITISEDRVDHRALIDDEQFRNLVLTKYGILRVGHERVTDLQNLLERIEVLLLQSLGRDPGAN